MEDFLIYQNELEHHISEIEKDVLFVTTLDVIQLKRLIGFIQTERNWIKSEPERLEESTGIKLNALQIQSFKERILLPKFQLFDKIELVCKTEFIAKTKHLKTDRPIKFNLRDWLKNPEKFEKLWYLIENEIDKTRCKNKGYYAALIHYLDKRGYLIKTNAKERCKIAAETFLSPDSLNRVNEQSRDFKEYESDFENIPTPNKL